MSGFDLFRPMKFWIEAKDPHVHRAMNSWCETAKSPDAYEQQLYSELLRSVCRENVHKSPSRGSFQLFDSQQINQTLPPYTHYCTRPRTPSCPCDWKRPWNTSVVGPLTLSSDVLLLTIDHWLADYPNLILNKVTCTWACFKLLITVILQG